MVSLDFTNEHYQSIFVHIVINQLYKLKVYVTIYWRIIILYDHPSIQCLTPTDDRRVKQQKGKFLKNAELQ